jgi:hypothetical protein
MAISLFLIPNRQITTSSLFQGTPRNGNLKINYGKIIQQN